MCSLLPYSVREKKHKHKQSNEKKQNKKDTLDDLFLPVCLLNKTNLPFLLLSNPILRQTPH
jgi:hypothetical protein